MSWIVNFVLPTPHANKVIEQVAIISKHHDCKLEAMQCGREKEAKLEAQVK
jgi:hypothetical protein